MITTQLVVTPAKGVVVFASSTVINVYIFGNGLTSSLRISYLYDHAMIH